VKEREAVKEGAILFNDVQPTGQRPRILLVGGPLKHVRKALDLGLDVVFAQYPYAYDREFWPYVEQGLLLDYGDVDQLLPLAEALHKVQPFQRVVTLMEFGLMPTAQVNEALGLDAVSVDTVSVTLDKSRMRRRLAETGVSPVASAVGRSAQDVRDFVEANGLPIIVKPIRESGSLAVFLIRDQAGVEAVAEQYQALNDKEWAVGDLAFSDTFEEFLMEEFLEGPEISIETMSFDGRHVVIGTTDEEFGGTGFCLVGQNQPSMQPAEALREAAEVVFALLDAVGLRNGPGHTEVILTPRGPRIVESHNRIGGYAVNEMTEVAYGIDMERYALAAGLGVLEPLTASPELQCGTALRAIVPEPGRVVEVTGFDAVREDPAYVFGKVRVKPGDVVRPLTWNEDISGYVIARGATAEEAIANGKRLAAAVHVRTEPIE
jgi:biotin carboxylase